MLSMELNLTNKVGFVERGSRCYSFQIDNDSEHIDEQNSSLQLYDSLLLSVEQALKSNVKQAKSLTSELNKAQQAEVKLHRANLITSNLYRLPPGTSSITVEDWENDGAEFLLELETDKYSSPNEEAEALFAVSRRMKRGSVVVKELLKTNDESQRMLANAKSELQHIYNMHADMKQLEAPEFLEDVIAMQTKLKNTQKVTKIKFLSKTTPRSKSNANPNRKGKTAQTQGFRTLESPYSKLKILVGRNRRENEQISLQIARKTDIWLHARGCPGAHVLIKKRRGDPDVTPECLQFAANLAAFYSDSRTERKAMITVAEPKHIQKPRGAPLGAVKIRQELQTLIGNPMDVPEDLKLKREENGGYWGDEGGLRSLGGKIKNRKKTANVTKQNIAKKRAEKRQKNKRKNRGNGDGDDSPKIVNGVQEGDWW